MSILTIISDVLFTSFEQAGRRKALVELSNMNDRTLEDLGISRALLSQGVKAWPWKSDVKLTNTVKQSKRSEIKAAIKELQALNDKDLADIGISRGEISHVAKFGRSRNSYRAA